MSAGKTDDPWAREVPAHYGVPYTIVCDAQSRLAEIKASSDIPWLRRVAAWPDNQVSVRVAAERRLKQLARGRAP